MESALEGLLDAIGDGDLEQVCPLLSLVADLNATNARGESLLDAAMMRRDPRILRAVLSAGANVNQNAGRGRTHLHLVDDILMMQELLRAGADIRAVDELGNTPLHVVSTDMLTTELLLSGADPNAENLKGRTALHCAVLTESTREILCIYIQEGAKLEVVDRDGNTPLLLALMKRNSAQAEFLLQAGANPGSADSQGRDARWWANKSRMKNISLMLGAPAQADSNVEMTAVLRQLLTIHTRCFGGSASPASLLVCKLGHSEFIQELFSLFPDAEEDLRELLHDNEPSLEELEGCILL